MAAFGVWPNRISPSTLKDPARGDGEDDDVAKIIGGLLLSKSVADFEPFGSTVTIPSQSRVSICAKARVNSSKIGN